MIASAVDIDTNVKTKEEAIANLQASLHSGIELVDDPFGSWKQGA